MTLVLDAPNLGSHTLQIDETGEAALTHESAAKPHDEHLRQTVAHPKTSAVNRAFFRRATPVLDGHPPKSYCEHISSTAFYAPSD